MLAVHIYGYNDISAYSLAVLHLADTRQGGIRIRYTVNEDNFTAKITQNYISGNFYQKNLLNGQIAAIGKNLASGGVGKRRQFGGDYRRRLTILAACGGFYGGVAACGYEIPAFAGMVHLGTRDCGRFWQFGGGGFFAALPPFIVRFLPTQEWSTGDGRLLGGFGGVCGATIWRRLTAILNIQQKFTLPGGDHMPIIFQLRLFAGNI